MTRSVLVRWWIGLAGLYLLLAWSLAPAELVGGDDLAVIGRLCVSRLVRRVLHNFVRPRGHGLSIAGWRVGERELRVGVSHRKRDRGWRW